MPPPPPPRRVKPRLGEVLVSMGVLTHEQAEGVSVHQKQWGMSFGRAAISRGLCTDDQVIAALAKQTGMAAIDLEKVSQSPEVIGMLPLAAAQQHRAVLLGIDGTTLKMAMAAPASFPAQDAIRAVVGRSRLEVVLASDVGIERAICRFYGLPVADTERIVSADRELADPQDAVTGLQPMVKVTPQVAEMPKPRPAPSAPPRPQGQSTGALGKVEISELLGLSPRAADLVKRMGQSNKLTAREVIARIVEQWAAARKD